MFYSLLLVTGRIRDIRWDVLNLLLVNGRIRDIGQNVLRSSFVNWANTWHWTERFTVFFWKMGEYVTLDRTFYGLLLVTGRIRDIGQNVLQSSFGNWANTWHWTERFTVFFWKLGEYMTLDRTFYSLLLETWRIRDTGQNFSVFFQTVSSSSPHLPAHFLPYRIPPGGLY